MSDLEIKIIDGEEEGGGIGSATDDASALKPPIIQELLDDSEDSVGRKLKDYIFTEIDALLEEETRSDFLAELSQIRKEREGEPDQAKKTHPWPGCSNLRVPLSMFTTQEVYAMIKDNFVKTAPLWSVTAKAEEDKEVARGIEALISFAAESKDHANVRQGNNTLFYNGASEGLAIMKVPWVKEKFYYKTNDSDELIEVVRRDSPLFKPVPNEYFLIRPEWSDIQRAPWVATIDLYFEHELIGLAAQGHFDPTAVEAVIAVGPDELSRLDVDRMELEGRSPSDTEESKQYLCCEVFVFWDIFNTGQFVDLVLTIHPESGQVLRADYNDIQYRPLFNIGYGIRPFSLQQLGVGQMLHGMQAEMDFLHNIRVDASHMMLSPPAIVDASVDISDNEVIHPGKVLRGSGAEKAVQWLQIQLDLGTSIMGEGLTKSYAERTTGATSAQAGMESTITKSGATMGGTQFLASQGGRIFGSHLEVIRDAYSEGGKILAFQLLTHKDEVEEWIPHLDQDVQEAARVALSALQPQDLPSRFTFSVKTTDAQRTEEAKKQMRMTLIQLYTIYGQQVVQLAAQIYSPQSNLPVEIKDILNRLLLGQTELMKQVFDDMNQEKGKDFVAYTKDVQLLIDARAQFMDQQIGGMKNGENNSGGFPGMEPGGNGPGGVPQPNPQQGMEGMEQGDRGLSQPLPQGPGVGIGPG